MLLRQFAYSPTRKWFNLRENHRKSVNSAQPVVEKNKEFSTREICVQWLNYEPNCCINNLKVKRKRKYIAIVLWKQFHGFQREVHSNGDGVGASDTASRDYDLLTL